MSDPALYCESEKRYRLFQSTGESKPIRVEVRSSDRRLARITVAPQLMYACAHCGWQRGYGTP